MNILAVDDESELRNLYHTILSEEGHNVATASNGGEAIAKIEKERFDILILDLKMPDMSGIEVLKNVKDRIKETLVIIVTAYPSLESSIDAIKSGVYDYIVKPFSPNDLRMAVRLAAEKIKLVEENKRLMAQLENTNRELREKLLQLEKFTKIAASREEKMADLKEKVRDLEERLGGA